MPTRYFTISRQNHSSDCLDEAIAIGFIEATLSPSERVGVPEHLASCDACREWLAALAKCGDSVGEVPPSISDPFLNTTIGRYKLVAPLGAGSAGLVYKAYDPALDRFIAVKLLRTLEQESLRKSFVREAQAMARLSDPHVVSIFDVGEADGELYIAMELVEAGTLTQWLAKQPRGWRQIIEKFIDIGTGLQKIHEADFVHRDIKPDNILISTGGERALVGDLGLSGATNGRVVVQVGTPAYMAPEIQEGKPATPQSDQFSFCCSLYQALTGQRWLAASSNSKEARELIGKTGVPMRITDAVMRGLSTTPADRFPSMTRLVLTLQAPSPQVSWPVRFTLLLGLAIPLFLVWGYWRDRASTIDTCSEVARQLDQVWSSQKRLEVRELFLRSGRMSDATYFESFTSLFDPYITSLRSEQLQTCNELETSTSGILHARAACLDERLGEARSILKVLGSAGDIELAQVVRLAGTLTPISVCHGEHPFSLPPPPIEISTQVAKLRSELQLAEISLKLGAVSLAKQFLSSVLSLTYKYDIHYPPFHAEHAYVEAMMQLELIGEARAHAALQRAAELADLAGHDRARANALTALVALSFGTYKESIENGQRALAVLERINAPAVTIASVESSMAELHFRHGELATSKFAGTRALALLKNATSEYSGRVANVLDTLAVIETDSKKALELVRKSLRLRRLEDATPPDLARTLVVYAEVLRSGGSPNESLQPLQEALSLEQTLGGPQSAKTATILTRLCLTLTDIAAADLQQLDTTRLALAKNTCWEAISIYEDLLEPDGNPTRKKVPKGEWFQHRRALADALSLYARIFLLMGEYEKALEIFEQSLELVELGSLSRAMTGVGIAMCLEALKQDRTRARALAEQARPLYSQRLSGEENAQLERLLDRLQVD